MICEGGVERTGSFLGKHPASSVEHVDDSVEQVASSAKQVGDSVKQGAYSVEQGDDPGSGGCLTES